MTPRRAIIDSLYRCLCPKYFNLLSPRGSGLVAALAATRLSPLSLLPVKKFSFSAPHRQSVPELASEATHQDADHYPEPPPLQYPLVRKVNCKPETTNAPRRRTHQRYTGSSAIVYRSQGCVYYGIKKVTDLAAGAAFPEVFVAARELVKGEGYVPDMKLFTALIGACANFPGCLLQDLAFRLVDEMKERGMMPDSVIYHHLLKLLSNSPDYIKRSQVLEEMRQGWHRLTDEGWHYVILGYIIDGHLEMALEIMERRRKQGQVMHRNTYRDVIQKLCFVGEVDEALRMVRVLETELTWATSPALAYHCLVAATDQVHFEATMLFWRKIIDKDMFSPDDGLCLATLNVAACYGDPPLASDVFRILGNRGLKFEEHHYAALLQSYAVAGDLVAAFSVLSVMRKAGVTPAENTGRPIVTRLLSSDEAAIEKAFDILQKMWRVGKNVDIAALNVLITVHVKRGNLEAAFAIYNAMPDFELRPEARTFNLLLKGAALQGKKEFAMNLVSEMKETKVQPDADTYEWAFNSCLVKEDYEDAFVFLEEMRAAGMLPKVRMLKALASRCYAVKDARYKSALVEMLDRGMDLTEFCAELDRQGYEREIKNR